MKTKLLTWLGLFAMLFTLNSSLQADEIGLKVGDQAPEFILNDQDGGKVRLSELIAKHDKVALVFYRSADWCPFCKKQMIGLQEELETLETAGVGVVGISYDSVEVLGRFSKKNQLGYTLLSDPGSNAIDAYEIRNDKVRPGRAEGIPHPIVFLVNKEGIISAKLREEGYRDRPQVEEIVTAAKAMD